MHDFLKLLFIRHAQSTGNVSRRMQGHGEFELTETGKQQAEKLARRLITEGWLPTHVYSSPLQRTVQTTQILMEQLEIAPLPANVADLMDGSDSPPFELPEVAQAIPVNYVNELLEHQNGIFRGLTWTEAKARHPDLCHQLEASPDWIPIPHAETLQEARHRAQAFISSILQNHRNGDRLWIITHSWILQHLIAALLGSDRSWRIQAVNTALFEFWVDQSRWELTDQNRFNTDLWQIRRINDHRHLYS